MTEDLRARRVWTSHDNDKISLFAIGSTLLRWRWLIVALGVIGFVLGLRTGLIKPRLWVSTATFIPEASQGGTSGLAQAASQFGFAIPSGGGAWGPSMYAELIRTRALLIPIALETLSVAEKGGRRVALMDLLKIKAPTPEIRATIAVAALRGLIDAKEEKKLGGLKVSVATEWPSVSLSLAARLVQRVNQFNLETRKSQAAAERQFVERQAAEAEEALREAENRLQAFLQRNRDIGSSPALAFERDRLQREVARQNQIYLSWLQNREEARIREVRDTPVITVVDSPQLPFLPEPRKSAQKALLGTIAGVMLGALLAFLADTLSIARQSKDLEAREFFRLVENATPRVLRREEQRSQSDVTANDRDG